MEYKCRYFCLSGMWFVLKEQKRGHQIQSKVQKFEYVYAGLKRFEIRNKSGESIFKVLQVKSLIRRHPAGQFKVSTHASDRRLTWISLKTMCFNNLVDVRISMALNQTLLLFLRSEKGSVRPSKKKKEDVSRPDLYKKKEAGGRFFFVIYYFLLHAFLPLYYLPRGISWSS